jgi:hypothetical protein
MESRNWGFLGRMLRLSDIIPTNKDKVMPKRKEPELTPEEQYKRFKEAAKEADVTTDERQFEQIFKKVAGQKPKPDTRC